MCDVGSYSSSHFNGIANDSSLMYHVILRLLFFGYRFDKMLLNVYSNVKLSERLRLLKQDHGYSGGRVRFAWQLNTKFRNCNSYF